MPLAVAQAQAVSHKIKRMDCCIAIGTAQSHPARRGVMNAKTRQDTWRSYAWLLE